ncbi:ion transporter [Streptomyces acidiscabies]|uniref:Ion transporter n=2 Tax=Streptomyces acidiscabies TaxID=42234 RepID=A0AAP6BB16_9ACTN|nr:ion transporter [Streptomyces acidiscabies]MDX2961471.1 ion transporter [Streptomyces acidiscabies]MDX3023259.1 ion transporter [Streptomyces acidiscabies]MDX3792193.1 ion transporter [Streptomyces acidiscabies]GAV45400.1 ion transport protein [Streptomyces acidiscabies]
MAERCRAVTESDRFVQLMLWLILANALLLGVETYSGVVAAWRPLLKAVEHVFLAAFAVEAVLRIAAHADRPSRYVRDPWNLFDLAIVLLAFLPVAGENATMLRLLRLARVLRAARMLPQLRIIIVAVGKSLPGAVGFALACTLLLYLYAMLGWILFAEADPAHYGSLGRATLTLFLLVTLDGVGETVRAGLAISPWSIFYFASYVLFGSFILVNLLIGVVLNSLDEARRLEEAVLEKAAVPHPQDAASRLRGAIVAARAALDDLESSLEPAATRRIDHRTPEVLEEHAHR